jgi:hypothetical protein
VAGPQPLVVPGVLAGSLLVVAGALALVHAREAGRARTTRVLAIASAVPAAIACLGLLLPAIVARVDVAVTGGAFVGSWALNGAESVAGWAALALTALVIVATVDARPTWPVTAALAACAAWPWLLDVPTHVWSASLAPAIQQYYGTEYGSILFASLANPAMIGAVVLGAAAMVAIMVARRSRGGRPHVDNGGL